MKLSVNIYRVSRAQADWTLFYRRQLPVKVLRHLQRKMPPHCTTYWEALWTSDKPAQRTQCIMKVLGDVAWFQCFRDCLWLHCQELFCLHVVQWAKLDGQWCPDCCGNSRGSTWILVTHCLTLPTVPPVACWYEPLLIFFFISHYFKFI